VARLEVEVIVTTSQPIPAYGGIALGDNVLQDLAASLRGNSIPLVTNHDRRRPIDGRCIDAQVRDRDDGYREVWALLDVDEEAWRAFEAERDAAGAPGGMSFSGSVPLGTYGPEGATADDAVIAIAADMATFSQDEIVAAATELGQIGIVAAGERFEFAHDPQQVVDFSIQFSVLVPLGVSIAANIITLALARFLRPQRPTIFHFHIHRQDSTITGRVETSDRRVLERSIEALEELAACDPSPGAIQWDDEGIHWRADDQD
jgi:hypothetical protein